MQKFLRILRIFLVMMGGIFLLITILAFTSAPFWIWYNMSVRNSGIHRPPEYVILLGGGGMPSESGLIRCWYTAGVANYFQHSGVIIALPGDTGDSLSSVNGMKRELILRGISPERILTEDSGTNTRSQALNIFRRIGELTSDPDPRFRSLLIVTSPEHLNRAVLTFRKAGFMKVDGLPAFESAIESDITFDAGKLGGRKMIPDIGKNLTLRYQFWTQLHYEELIFRELFALGYYKVKGWI
jgi:uncharacterized SAM-binding protein YcdF (DUF218 family)